MKKWQLIGGLVLLAVLSISPMLHFARAEAPSDIELSRAARSYLDAGNFASASGLYTQLLSEYPESPKAPEAILELALIKDHNHAPKIEIISAFERAATAYPDTPEAAEALFHAAQSRLKDCNKIQGIAEFDEALQAFEKAIAHPKATPERVARCRMQMGFIYAMRYTQSHDKADLQAAASALQVSADSSIDTPAHAAHSLIGVGRAQILLHNYDDAEMVYRTAMEFCSDKLPFEYSMALYGLGMTKSWRGDYKECASILQQFLHRIPGATYAEKDAAWRAGYSPDYAREGLYAVGLARIQLAFAKFMAGNPPAAKQELEQVCKDYADSPVVISSAKQFLDFVAPASPFPLEEQEQLKKALPKMAPQPQKQGGGH